MSWMWFSYKERGQSINIKVLPDSFFPCAQSHLSSNCGIAIHNKKQHDLSKQVTEIQATSVPVMDLKLSLHTSHFGRSFQMESFTLVSDWETVELFHGKSSNTEATARENLEQLAPLSPTFQTHILKQLIPTEKSKTCNLSIPCLSMNATCFHRGVL